MATIRELYIRTQVGHQGRRPFDAVRDRLERSGGAAPVELLFHPSSCWICIRGLELDVSSLGQELSRQLSAEVLALAAQTAVNVFLYERWRNGDLLRRLEFGMGEQEQTWSATVGTPEAWEQEALFDAEDRARAERSSDPSGRTEIARAYEQRIIELGSPLPAIDARAAASAVAAHFGITEIQLDGREYREVLFAAQRPWLPLAALGFWAIASLYIVAIDAPKIWAAALLLFPVAIIALKIRRDRSRRGDRRSP